MPDPDENEVDPDDDAFRRAPAPRVQPDALPPENIHLTFPREEQFIS